MIGITWGVGDSINTFNIPNVLGKVISAPGGIGQTSGNLYHTRSAIRRFTCMHTRSLIPDTHTVKLGNNLGLGVTIGTIGASSISNFYFSCDTTHQQYGESAIAYPITTGLGVNGASTGISIAENGSPNNPIRLMTPHIIMGAYIKVL
jgi:hypothetical protein